MDTGRENEVANFYQKWLGLPWAAEGNKLSVADLDAAIGRHSTGPMAQPCVIGIDVNPATGLHYCVLTAGEKLLVDAGITTWGELGVLYKQHKIVATVIDIRPETTNAKALQQDKDNVWLCEFGDLGGRYYDLQTKTDNDIKGRSSRVAIIKADRTEMLDQAFADIRARRIVLPGNARSLGRPIPGKGYGEFYAQLLAPIRTYEERKTAGVATARAVYRSGQDDHFAFSLGYANLAASIGQRGGDSVVIGERMTGRFKI